MPNSDLVSVENLLFSVLKIRWETFNVKLPNGETIHTFKSLITGKSSHQSPPLVLIHGYASGKGLWAPVLDDLATRYQVYALDLLGHALSSRPVFPKDSQAAEDTYIASLEEWRIRLNLEEFNLAGHSFGGYLSFKYAMKYPNRVKHLILLDPWGFGGVTGKPKVSPLLRAGVAVHRWNPTFVLRAMGPLGRKIMGNFRGDLVKRLKPWYGDSSTVIDYLYLINSQPASGERAFVIIADFETPAYAKRPILKDLPKLLPGFPPITIIAGSQSWILRFTDFREIRKFPFLKIDMRWLDEAGHHLFLDKPFGFNKILLGTLRQRDANSVPSVEK